MTAAQTRDQLKDELQGVCLRMTTREFYAFLWGVKLTATALSTNPGALHLTPALLIEVVEEIARERAITLPD